jgi:sugar lactone lactonase YvrE
MSRPSENSPTIALDVRAETGEGPIWDAARGWLVFVDIMRGDVHALDPVAGDHRTWHVDKPVGAVACTVHGDWLLAAGTGFIRLDPDTGRTTPVADAASGRDDVRMNDGYVDAAGRFWAGTMSLRHETGQGTLYRLDPDGSVHTMLAPVTTSNGLDWSPDNRLMYYADTRTMRVDVFDFDLERGAISGRRPFVQFSEPPARPDGLVVDSEGGVWVALYEGGAVHRYRADGTLDVAVALPEKFTTKPAFGGPGLTQLYVTTARGSGAGIDSRDGDHAGALFRIETRHRGKPACLFGG